MSSSCSSFVSFTAVKQCTLTVLPSQLSKLVQNKTSVHVLLEMSGSAFTRTEILSLWLCTVIVWSCCSCTKEWDWWHLSIECGSKTSVDTEEKCWMNVCHSARNNHLSQNGTKTNKPKETMQRGTTKKNEDFTVCMTGRFWKEVKLVSCEFCCVMEPLDTNQWSMFWQQDVLLLQ